MALAISSLPVPVSPWIKTAASTGATVWTASQTRYSPRCAPITAFSTCVIECGKARTFLGIAAVILVFPFNTPHYEASPAPKPSRYAGLFFCLARVGRQSHESSTFRLPLGRGAARSRGARSWGSGPLPVGTQRRNDDFTQSEQAGVKRICSRAEDNDSHCHCGQKGNQ